MNPLELRIKQIEDQVRALRIAQSDFLTTRIEERDMRIDGSLSMNGCLIYSGVGVPTKAVPTGSLYLRKNGTASNTLYVREATAWRRVNTSA